TPWPAFDGQYADPTRRETMLLHAANHHTEYQRGRCPGFQRVPSLPPLILIALAQMPERKTPRTGLASVSHIHIQATLENTSSNPTLRLSGSPTQPNKGSAQWRVPLQAFVRRLNSS